MTMETRKEIAAEKKRCGSHNCTQAVLCTYHDFTGMDEETIKNAGNAFAAGMGNMEGTGGGGIRTRHGRHGGNLRSPRWRWHRTWTRNTRQGEVYQGHENDNG